MNAWNDRYWTPLPGLELRSLVRDSTSWENDSRILIPLPLQQLAPSQQGIFPNKESGNPDLRWKKHRATYFPSDSNNFCHLSLSWRVRDRRIAVSSKPCQTTQWIPSQFVIWNPTPSQNLKRKQHTQTHRYIHKQTNKTKTKAQNYVKQPVQLWKSTIFCSVFHFFSPIVLNLRCG